MRQGGSTVIKMKYAQAYMRRTPFSMYIKSGRLDSRRSIPLTRSGIAASALERSAALVMKIAFPTFEPLRTPGNNMCFVADLEVYVHIAPSEMGWVQLQKIEYTTKNLLRVVAYGR